jgi:hypothetical protein
MILVSMLLMILAQTFSGLVASLVGIDVVRTPDLGRGGAHAGGGSLSSSYSRAISSSSILILPKTTGLPSPSRHHCAFRRRHAVNHPCPFHVHRLLPSRCAPPPPLPPGHHNRHRHHRGQTHSRILAKKEAAASPPPAYQLPHHREHVYKSNLFNLYSI